MTVDQKLRREQGYVVEARALLPLLPTQFRDEAEELIEDLEIDALRALFGRHRELCPGLQPQFTLLGPEDEPGYGMQRETIYAVFNLADMYDLRPSALLQELMSREVAPLFSIWGRWQ